MCVRRKIEEKTESKKKGGRIFGFLNSNPASIFRTVNFSQDPFASLLFRLLGDLFLSVRTRDVRAYAQCEKTIAGLRSRRERARDKSRARKERSGSRLNFVQGGKKLEEVRRPTKHIFLSLLWRGEQALGACATRPPPSHHHFAQDAEGCFHAPLRRVGGRERAPRASNCGGTSRSATAKVARRGGPKATHCLVCRPPSRLPPCLCRRPSPRGRC